MSEQLTIELGDCERFILDEIADKTFTQRDIAQTYALSMRSRERDTIDWAKVNRAIMERWSHSGLERIKQMAWSGRCWNA